MDLKEFENNIPVFIEQALSTADRISEGNTHLTPSLESLGEMDSVVDFLHNLQKKNLIDGNVVWNSSVAFGVLLGEMIIREHGFHWVMEDQMPMVETDDGMKMSPITKIYKILTDDENCEGTPSGFYDGLKALRHYQSMSGEGSIDNIY